MSLGRSESINIVPSLGRPQTEHILNLCSVNISSPEIVAIPPKMDVPVGSSPTANSSHVSELVPTNGGTLVTAGWDAVVVGGGWAVATAVSANNRQKVAARKHAMKKFRLLSS